MWSDFEEWINDESLIIGHYLPSFGEVVIQLTAENDAHMQLLFAELEKLLIEKSSIVFEFT